jgi:hypothetical protein
MNSTEKKLWAPKELAARWSMSRDTVLALWLAVSLIVHFAFFLPLMRRNSQIQ